MIVGMLAVELAIPGALSLKDKRRVIHSLRDRLHRDLKLAVGEVAHQESHARAGLGLAAVGVDGKRVSQVLDHADEMIRRQTESQVVLTRRWVVRTKDLPDADELAAGEPDHVGLMAELMAHFEEAVSEDPDLASEIGIAPRDDAGQQSLQDHAERQEIQRRASDQSDPGVSEVEVSP
jgi:hypothetical protein